MGDLTSRGADGAKVNVGGLSSHRLDYTGGLHYPDSGDPEAPEPFEAGWKDTVRAHSLMVTRIIVRFEGYTGRYVWHCHLLEHEDNEMMRPYDVLPGPVTSK